MRIQKYFTSFIALSLVVLTTLSVSPVSFAEIVSPTNIGSVSPVGSVELRGVGITGDGTLFSGDRVNVASGAYAKIVLGTGSKLELDGKSDVVVSRDGDTTNIEMKAGNIAFTGGPKPVRIRVGAYEVTATGQARGTIAYVGSSAFGVRVLDGSVSVRNLATKKSYTVQKGMEQIVSLTDSTQTGSVRLASAGLPSSIPAAPAMPRQSGGKKTALLVATVLGTGGAIALLMHKNDDSDQEAAARLRLTTASQTLSSVATTVSTATVVATQVDAATTAANTAINNAATSTTFTAAEKAALINQATALSSKAKASQTSIATLKLQLDLLTDSLANANGSTAAAIEAQIATILNSTNAEVAKLNQYIADLNKLVADANAEVPNLIPAPTIQLVKPAAPASGSNPA